MAMWATRRYIHPLSKSSEVKHEGEAYDQANLFKEDDQKYICSPDGRVEEYEHQAFVLGNLLLAPRQSDDSLCHKLIQTSCTISGNICDLVINNGSTENIVSRVSVTYLKLLVEKHPEPYKIGWIRHVELFWVVERCKVPLSIGKFYQDQVVDDVVDMDVCQIVYGILMLMPPFVVGRMCISL